MLELTLASIGQAILRVWDHFTLLGFVNRLAQGLVVSALLLPIILSVTQIVEDLKAPKEGK